MTTLPPVTVHITKTEIEGKEGARVNPHGLSTTVDFYSMLYGTTEDTSNMTIDVGRIHPQTVLGTSIGPCTVIGSYYAAVSSAGGTAKGKPYDEFIACD